MLQVRHSTTPEGNERMWLGLARVLGLLVMIAVFFLLGQNMVHNHYFSGGAQNYHNSPTGP